MRKVILRQVQTSSSIFPLVEWGTYSSHVLVQNRNLYTSVCIISAPQWWCPESLWSWMFLSLQNYYWKHWSYSARSSASLITAFQQCAARVFILIAQKAAMYFATNNSYCFKQLLHGQWVPCVGQVKLNYMSCMQPVREINRHRVHSVLADQPEQLPTKQWS